MLNLIVLAITLATTPAVKTQGPGPGGAPPQEPRQGPPQGGFQRQGPPQGGMMMGRGGGGQILRMVEVQVELKLNDKQKEQINQLMPQRGPDGFGPGGPGGGGRPGGPPPPGGGDPNGPPQGPPPGAGQPPQGPPPGAGQPPQGGRPGGPGGPGNNNRDAEMNAKLKEILDAGQFQRYFELSLQWQGPNAAMRPDVGEKLGITEEQRQLIREIMEKNRPQPPARPEPGTEPPRPDPEKMFKEMEARREKVNAEVLAVFTGEQKSKWTQMTGKPFKFNRQPPRFGGGGGGGR